MGLYEIYIINCTQKSLLCIIYKGTVEIWALALCRIIEKEEKWYNNE